jgi:hypothetical protein
MNTIDRDVTGPDLAGLRRRTSEAEKRSHEEHSTNRGDREELRPDHVKACAPIEDRLRE